MDQTKIARLEQLARLKASGALTDDEFTNAKTALLERRIVTDRTQAEHRAGYSEAAEAAETTKLSATWRFRFDFFDKHGLPGTKSYQSAFRSLRWRERPRLTFNVWGLLFGPLYFLYLGLW